MQAFSFSGHGNFSGSFAWDAGCSVSLQQTTDLQGAKADFQTWQQVGYPAAYNVAGTFSNKYGRGFYFKNEHGGSRSVWGVVIAFDAVCAEKCAQIEMDTAFPAVPYDDGQPRYDDRAMRLLMPYLFTPATTRQGSRR